MVAVIDYGAGNLFSVKNALDFLGYENKITNSADELKAADKLILPGKRTCRRYKRTGAKKAPARHLFRYADVV